MFQVLIEGATFLLILLLLVLAAWISLPASGPEPIYLKGGPRFEQNITYDAVTSARCRTRSMASPPQRTYFAAQYERPLTPSERTRLASEMDVRFLDAIPANSYIVSVPTTGGGPVMQRLLLSDPAARALVDIRHEDKLSLELYELDPAISVRLPRMSLRSFKSTGAVRNNLSRTVRPLLCGRPVVAATRTAQGLHRQLFGVRTSTLLFHRTVCGQFCCRKATSLRSRERPEVQSVEPGPPPTENDMDAARPAIGLENVSSRNWQRCANCAV